MLKTSLSVIIMPGNKFKVGISGFRPELGSFLRKLVLVLSLMVSFTHSHAQDNNSKAKELLGKAIKMEDEGNMDGALPLFNEAYKLDSNDYYVVYELGYYYYALKDYKKALESISKLRYLKGGNDQAYQMLGNIYDFLKDSTSAMKSYKEGLEKYPAAGRLYLEIGNMFYNRKIYDSAIRYYEKGIEVDPEHSSNYYMLSNLYLSSDQSIWGMIYGELFMNLERNSKRTEVMSKWLLDGYKSAIKIKSKDSMSVSFCKNELEIDGDLLKRLKKGKDILLPFSAIYEMGMLISIVGVDSIGLESTCQIRKRFIDWYYEQGNDKKYENVLFAYQHKIVKEGYFDAYSHWILQSADEVVFQKWYNLHHADWDAFIKWYKDNPIELNTRHLFLRNNSK